MWTRRVLLTIGVLLLAAGAAYAAMAWRSEIDAIAPPNAAEFDDEAVAEGARLAALGNCVDCHTAPDGPAYAGGYAMNTPYGIIYGTNITPDPDTGIGNWSEEAFIRSMREGVDREGRHLYPAFPYDQFTRATDHDLRAIYAYLMTREPVRYEAPPPEVYFPFQFRPLLAGWKLLFHSDERFQPDPDRTAEWNHGAYLVDGLAHCGACHTPRNVFGARQEEDAYLAGGESEEWHAPPLNQASPAPVPWNRESLARYLRTGLSPDHAVAAGPMAPVVRNLAQVPEEDVDVMAIYIASVMGVDEGAQRVGTDADEPAQTGSAPEGERVDGGHGAELFAGACAICHEPAGALYFSAEVDLNRSTSIEYADPRNVIHVILDGIEQPLTPGEPLMPGFATAFTDAQVAELAAYLRGTYSDEPPWDDLEDEVARVREAQREAVTHFEVTAGDAIEEAEE